MRKFLLLFAIFVLGLVGAYIYLLIQISDAQQIVADSDNVGVPEVVSCAEPRKYPGLSREIADITKGKSGYFRKNEFASKWVEQNDFINDWYGKHLKAMQELPLIDTTADKEVYRFLWLRSFHRPIAVRIEKTSDQLQLSLVETDGRGGYGPGDTLRREVKSIDNLQWCEFQALLDQAEFWTLAGDDKDPGQDGAQWIMEGVKNGRYHLVDRWSPETGAFRASCIYLLELSGIDTEKLGNDLY